MASESVKCRLCGWRGNRVFRACECDYEYCTHPGYGYCPKCGAGVETIKFLREEKIALAKYEAWSESPEGQEALKKFRDGHSRKTA